MTAAVHARDSDGLSRASHVGMGRKGQVSGLRGAAMRKAGGRM